MQRLRVCGLGLAIALAAGVMAQAFELGRVKHSALCREEAVATSVVVKRLHPGELATVIDHYQGWVNLDFGEEACWAPATALGGDDDAKLLSGAQSARPAAKRSAQGNKSQVSVRAAKSSQRRSAPAPMRAPRYPSGASAVCQDGSLSFSASRRGTCSHHGGVAEWL